MKSLFEHVDSLYESGKSLINESSYENETDALKRLKNVYLMDRVIRAMNNEEGLYDYGWLYEVEDESTDDGFESFKDSAEEWDYAESKGKGTYYYTSDEDYNHLVNMYKEILNGCASDGFMTRSYYEKREGNYKGNAGLDDEQLAFLKQDIAEPKLYESTSLKESTEPEEDKELDFEERVTRAYDNCNYSLRADMPTIKDILNYLDLSDTSENRKEVSDIVYKLGKDWQIEESTDYEVECPIYITYQTGPSTYKSEEYKTVYDTEQAADIVAELRAQGLNASYEIKFPNEDPDYDRDVDETNWGAEEEADADERFENRYMNGGNGYMSESENNYKVTKYEIENTGGNVMVAMGELSNGDYFGLSSDCVVIFDDDYHKAYLNDNLDSDWQTEHEKVYYDRNTDEYKEIANQIDYFK